MSREKVVLEALKTVSNYYDTCIFRTTGNHDGCPFSIGYECALEQYDAIEKAEKNVEQLEALNNGQLL